MQDDLQRAKFDIELDARGFCRVRILKGVAEGQLAFVGPSYIRAAFADAADVERATSLAVSAAAIKR